MTNLYLAWQNPASRQWMPVGVLTRHETGSTVYEFAYTEGARQAQESSRIWQVPGFPRLDQRYESSDLFPAFSDRLMNSGRPDRAEYLSYLDLDARSWNEMAELALSGGRAHSDWFEIFSEVVPNAEGYFTSRFVLQGLDQADPDAIRCADSLKAGDPLELQFESYSPNTTDVVIVKTRDHCTLGRLPNFLVSWLHQDDAWLGTDFSASVARVNPDAPLSHRLLVDFHGRVPLGFTAMRDLPGFGPIPNSVREFADSPL